MFKTLFFVVVLVVAVSVAGCGSSNTVTVTETVGSAPATRTAATPAVPRSHSLPSLGKTLMLPASYTTDAELSVTPLAVEYEAPEPNGPSGVSGFVKLRTGYHWTRVKIRANNRSNSAAEQSSVSYLLVDGDGTRFEAIPSNLYSPHLDCCGHGYSGDTMAPEDRAVGYVGFQVPNGRRPERLRAMTSPAASEPKILEWQVG